MLPQLQPGFPTFSTAPVLSAPRSVRGPLIAILRWSWRRCRLYFRDMTWHQSVDHATAEMKPCTAGLSLLASPSCFYAGLEWASPFLCARHTLTLQYRVWVSVIHPVRFRV